MIRTSSPSSKFLRCCPEDATDLAILTKLPSGKKDGLASGFHEVVAAILFEAGCCCLAGLAEPREGFLMTSCARKSLSCAASTIFEAPDLCSFLDRAFVQRCC